MAWTKVARTKIFLSLVFVIRSIAGETCISNCDGKPEGSYVLCGPKCMSGHFMTCTGEKGIEMPCAMGEYIHDNGTKYLGRLIFDPSMGACMYSNKICSTPEFEVTSCLTYGCSYRMDGEYPLCGKQCFEGYYAECYNGVLSRKSCFPETEVANSSALVFQPSTKKCETTTDVCEKDMETIKAKLKDKPMECVDSNCTGMPDGNYKFCNKEMCLDGHFGACVDGILYEMECALGWDVDKEGSRSTMRLIYYPATDSCEYFQEVCEPYYASAQVGCIHNCVGRPDGDYELCGEQCNGFYGACSNQNMEPMACPEGYVELENGETNLTRLTFNKLTNSCEDIKVECHGSSFNTYWSTNAGNRLSPSWLISRLLIKTTTLLHYFVV